MRSILLLFIMLLVIYNIAPTSQVYLNNLNEVYVGWRQIHDEEHKWIPAKPMNLIFNVTTRNNILEVIVTLVFNHGGYKVENVTQRVSGNELRGYMDVAMWTGPAIQVITFKNVTYTFTDLKPGEYLFNLYINNDLSGQVKIEIRENIVTVTNQQILFTPLLIALITILLIIVILIIIITVRIHRIK